MTINDFMIARQTLETEITAMSVNSRNCDQIWVVKVFNGELFTAIFFMTIISISTFQLSYSRYLENIYPEVTFPAKIQDPKPALQKRNDVHDVSNNNEGEVLEPAVLKKP